METKEKKNYEAPTLTVVEVQAERGYATSGVLSAVFLSLLTSGEGGSQSLEARNNDNNYTWGDGSWY